MLNNIAYDPRMTPDEVFVRLLSEDGRSLEDASRLMARKPHKVAALCRSSRTALADYSPGEKVVKLAWRKAEGKNRDLYRGDKIVGGLKHDGPYEFSAWYSDEGGSLSAQRATIKSTIKDLQADIERCAMDIFGTFDVEFIEPDAA